MFRFVVITAGTDLRPGREKVKRRRLTRQEASPRPEAAIPPTFDLGQGGCASAGSAPGCEGTSSSTGSCARRPAAWAAA